MANPQSPGVYVNIIDKSQYANVVVGDKSAIPILAESGELFVPHLITSRQEFINMYGYPMSRSAFYAYLLLSLSPIWVSRIAVINPNSTLADDENYSSIISDRTGTGSVMLNIERKIKAFQITYTTSWSDISLDSNEVIYLPDSIKTYDLSTDTPVYSECSSFADKNGNFFWAELNNASNIFDRVFKDTSNSKLGFITSSGDYILIDDTSGSGVDTTNVSDYTANNGDVINFYLTLDETHGMQDSDRKLFNFTLKYPGVCDNIYVKIYPIHESVDTDGNYYVDYVDVDILKGTTIIESYKSLNLYNPNSSNYYATVINDNSQNISVETNFSNKFYDFMSDDRNPNVTVFDTTFEKFSHTEYDGLDWEKFPLTDSKMENALSYSTFLTVADFPDDIFQSEYNAVDESDYIVYASSDVVEVQNLDDIKSGIVNSVNYVFDNYFGDDETYDFVRLSAPFVDVSNGILTGMNSLAEMRQDFFFVYDAYEPKESDFENSNCITNAKSIESNLPSSWKGAIAWSGGTQYNSFTSETFPQFASFALMRTMAYTDSISYPWYAPAGQTRGVVPEMIKVFYNPNKRERDDLMGFPRRINVIRNINGVGVTVFGQKTLSSVASAMDRINVARLALYLNKQLKVINNDLIFDLDTNDLWYTLRNRLNAIMSFVKTNNGVKSFQIANVTTSDEEDRNELHAVIAIIPTKAVEKIIIDCIFAPQGATLSDYIQS